MILFLATKVGGTNGNDRAVFDILNSLIIANYNVFLITKEINSNSLNYFQKIKLKLNYLHIFKRWPPTKDDKEEILKRILKSDIDLVISNEFSFHNLFFKFIKNNIYIKKYKTAIISHSQPKNYKHSFNKRNLLERFSIYEHFISVSKTVMNEWRDIGLSQDETHCHYVPNCCNEANANTLLGFTKEKVRKSLFINKDHFVCVCVASIQDRKNQRLIIDHLDEILKNDSKTHFYFVGPKSDYGGEEILTLIKNHPQCDRIHLTGEVSDALPYIRAADLLLLPSLGEVMPLSILEAMALKTPVLASKVGGIPEVIEAGIPGSLFDLENSKDFVKKFLLLKNDSSLRKQLANNAYRRYHSSFSRMNHIKRWKTTLKTILNL